MKPADIVDEWFPGIPTQADFDNFSLPTFQEVNQEITVRRLLYPDSRESNQRLEFIPSNASKDSQREIIRRRYDKVRHPTLDPGSTDDTWRALSICHDGLIDARAQDYLDHEGLYYLAIREIAWVQQQLGAGQLLGRFDDGKWWIAHSGYTLSVPQPRFSSLGGLSTDEDNSMNRALYGNRSNDVSHFYAAEYTLHFVHHGNDSDEEDAGHYALLIYHRETGHAWYLDSMKQGRKLRARDAVRAFERWIIDSRATVPKRLDCKVVNSVINQTNGWSCGLHCVANAIAFVRFGVFGWDKVPVFRTADEDGTPGGMLAVLLESMHNVMNMRAPKFTASRAQTARAKAKAKSGAKAKKRK